MLRDATGKPVDEGDWFIDLHPNLEMNWAADEGLPRHTPTERFFVRNHTSAPDLNADTWRLRVTGDGVQAPREYSLADLQALGETSYDRVLECTGNGRRYFGEMQGTPRPGAQWGLGGVGLARWTGVPLREVLSGAGLRDDAVQVMAIGLDAPYVTDGTNHGPVRRPLPLDKALDDTIVAWAMNGQPLPADHGFPARLVVPGWIGIASIKWLGELRVDTAEVDSPWNTTWYRMHGAGWDGDAAVLDRMPVKSLLVLTPTEEAGLRAGEETVLRGRAWAGEATVAGVEVSTDGGLTWTASRLTGPNEESGWVAWELPWTPPTAGEHEIRTRATDSRGRTQPDVAPDNEDGYLFWAVVPRSVTVR